MAKCKHCGIERADHCPGFEPEQTMPPGCVCDPGTWDWDVEPPAPCDQHVGDPDCHCERCEHDFACHQADKKTEEDGE